VTLLKTEKAMKTLFLNPPSFEGFDGGAGARYQAKREIKSFWYPTWLAQPAAIINAMSGGGGDAKLIDAPADELTIEQTMARSKGFELAILHTSTPSFANDIKVAERLRDEVPGIKVGFCGAHVAVMPEKALLASKAIDFVCGKEFDYTIAEVAQGRDLADVDGLSWRDRNGKIHHNRERELIHDMDQLPTVLDVYRRDLKIENYFIGYLQHPYLSLYTGRGCPARCTFCLWPQTVGGHTYRTQSPSYVIEEMRRAKELFPQVKEFFFDDDTFTADLKRTEEIAKGLGKLGITWSCNSRANVPYETLKVMKDNGLRLLLVGYESGNEEILVNIKKGVRKDRYVEFARDVKKLGIVTHGTFIVGLPGETKQTVEETIKFACEIDPETIQVSLAAPYPGTFLYDQAVREGWLDAPKLEHLDGLGQQTAAIGYPHMKTAEIAEALETFYKRFYFRWKPISRIVKEMLEDRKVMMRRLREGKEFFTFMFTRKGS
jgi:hopanoid biosynthesis associated radical SAM protein HpnJ